MFGFFGVIKIVFVLGEVKHGQYTSAECEKGKYKKSESPFELILVILVSRPDQDSDCTEDASSKACDSLSEHYCTNLLWRERRSHLVTASISESTWNADEKEQHHSDQVEASTASDLTKQGNKQHGERHEPESRNKSLGVCDILPVYNEENLRHPAW